MLSEYGTAETSGTSNYEPSDAPIVFLDQAPNQVNGIFSDCNCAGCASGAQVLADNFTVVSAGPTYGITEIVMWGGYFPENIPNTTDDFTIIIYEDAAGAPGAVVYTATGLLPTTRTSTGIVLFGVDEYLFTFDYSASPIFILAPGDYHITIINNSVESSSFFWETGNLDAVNGIIGQSWAPECVPPAAWNYDGATDMAVQVNGDDDLGGGGGGFPEVLYYTFDETGQPLTENFAVPGRGDPFAQVMGALTLGAAGQFGSALVGAGGSSGTDYVDTGWITDIGTSDWTISLWLSNLVDSISIHYVFGDNTAGSYRCFYNGVAPAGGILLRGGGLTDVPVTGVQPGPSVVHWVYDSSVPEVRAYLNGVFQSAVSQVALDINGTAPFKIGGYATSSGLEAGGLLDEFRFYDRALDDAEVLATWNMCPVPVELTSFTASVNNNAVTLSWETATEINNSGFDVERKSTVGEYDKIGFVPGFGTITEPRAYSFSDVNLLPGTYTYRLKQIDYDGTFEYSDPVEVDIIVPDVYSLHQNYPNPFNPSTKITFTLAANANVTLKVFDVLGQEVMTLINQDITAGVHTYDFDAAGINSGVYFYRIEANGIDGTNFTSVKKMILLK
jgi:hypothetical protein